MKVLKQAGALKGLTWGLAGTLMLAQLGGCASWFRGESQGPKPAALVQFQPAAKTAVVWQGSVGSAGHYFFVPAVNGDAVFAADRDGHIARFDLNTGKQIWRVDTGKKLSGGVGAGDGIVLAGTDRGEVLAYDFSGKTLWTARVSSEVLAAPSVSEGVVVVRSGDGHIFGLDPQTGKQKWVYQRSLPVLALRSAAGVLAERGAVFAGFAGGKLVALALSNGNVGWEAAVAQPKGATELERITDVTSLPVADQHQICAVAYQGRLACFDIQNGNLLWAKELSSSAGLAMDNRYLYVTDTQGSVLAFDKTTGTSVWKQDKLFARGVSGPAVIGRYVAVGDYQGYIHFLSKDDGSFAARVPTDGSAVNTAPVVSGDLLLTQTQKGGVFALAIQ